MALTVCSRMVTSQDVVLRRLLYALFVVFDYRSEVVTCCAPIFLLPLSNPRHHRSVFRAVRSRLRIAVFAFFYGNTLIQRIDLPRGAATFGVIPSLVNHHTVAFAHHLDTRGLGSA